MTYAYIGEASANVAEIICKKYSDIIVTAITENGKRELSLVNPTEKKLELVLRVMERRYVA